ncbi:hypothetical protein BU17DRAFT_89700 [Hysterangium stoloniferum]|nr:hypothetical protein BU17DRAFT_89700 [Hysterangium stoloniferum]
MASVEERRQLLHNDPDISIVEPHRSGVATKTPNLIARASIGTVQSASQRPDANHNSTNTSSQSNALVSESAAIPAQEAFQNLVRAPSLARRVSQTAEPSHLRSSDTGTASSASAPVLRIKVQELSKTASSLGNRPILLLSPDRKQCAELAAQQLVSPSNGTRSTYGSMPPLMMGLSSSARPASSRLSFPGRSAEESTQMHVTAPARVRSQLISGKEGELFTNGSGGIAVATFPTPEHLSPERKPSYTALMREPYLSSRTPYSHGLWKGHLQKSSRHNGAQAANADEEYDTASGHSHEGVGSGGIVALQSEATEKMKGSYPVPPEGKASGGQDATPAFISQISDMLPPDAPSDPTVPDLFELKATTQNSFGPRHQREEDATIFEQNNIFEGDVPSFHGGSRTSTTSVLVDVDASIVESRRVKCGIYERWIKGSNTKEFSLQHWVKHKKKCIRHKKALEAEPADPADARRTILAADLDLKSLEPHSALYNMCDKVGVYQITPYLR